ncbi:MAG: hypothetical protein ACP5FT_04280 [Acidilobus sp.]
MQAEVPRLRPASADEVRALREFAARIGASYESVAANPYVLEVPRGFYKDVFDIPRGLESVLGLLGSLYAAGYYIGSIGRDGFRPGLPLAQRLSRLCEAGIKCVELDLRGARSFLYGMAVGEEHIVRFTEGIAIVLDPLGEALGWGVGRRVRLKTKVQALVEPVIDLGWYLRRGG